MDVLASLPADITRHRVLGPKDTAAFLGMTISQLRRMREERRLPRPIMFSMRRYGWRIGDLIDWLDEGAPSQLRRNFAVVAKQNPNCDIDTLAALARRMTAA